MDQAVALSTRPLKGRMALRTATLVAIIVAVEMAVVLGVLGFAHLSIASGDSFSYDNLARNLVDHSRFSLDHSISPADAPAFAPALNRTIGYPLFVAAIYSIAGRAPLAIRVAQFCLLAILALAVADIGRCYFSARASKLAALITATYAPLVFFPVWLYPEGLATCLTVASICALVRLWKRGGADPIWALACGLAVGAAVLVRQTAAVLLVLPLAVVLCAALRQHSRAHVAALAMVLVGFGLVAGPWMVRNVLLTRAFLPLGTGSGAGLLQTVEQYSGTLSNAYTADEWRRLREQAREKRERADRMTPMSEPVRLGAVRPDVMSQVIYDRLCKDEGMARLRGLSTARVIRAVPGRVVALWKPFNSAPSPWNSNRFNRFVQLQHVLILLLALLGIVANRRRLSAQWPLWIVPVLLTAVYLCMPIEPRYVMPMLPFAALYAAVGLASLLDRPWRRVGAGRERGEN